MGLLDSDETALMVLKVGALARLAGAGRHTRIQQWVAAHHGRATTVASAALGSLAALISLTALGAMTARYGTRGRWALLVDALSLGWLVGAITFAALMRDRAPDPRWAAIARWLLWSTLPVFCLREIGLHGLLHYGWDRWAALFISAWLVVLIGLQLVASTPERLHKALQRLRDRGVLSESVEAGDGMERDLERIAHHWSLVGGLFVPVAVLVTEGLLSALPDWRNWLVGPFGAYQILNLIASSVVGAWAGRMAGYGRLGHVLAKRGLELRVVPGHPDGAGGLRPIGAFYLYQSLMASLPAVFLIVWVLLFWLWHAHDALDQYLWLLALAILVEALVFVHPMLSVHASMREQKKAFLDRADQWSREIDTAQTRLEDPGLEERDAVKRQLAEAVERFQTLEKAPTWPMDQSIRRRITLQNIVLLLPLAGSLLALLKRLG
jgi:hypothetical protein